MQQLSSLSMSVAALLAGAAACRAPARVNESNAEQLTGCFRRIYADGAPPTVTGSVFYTLTTDAGATRLLEVSPALLDGAGGASLLDRQRVSVVLAPTQDSANARARGAQVREIRRSPGSSGAPC
jgi:hypothetical protein